MECTKAILCHWEKNQRKWTVKRGEVYFVDLGENVGSEENKIRPVVVLQSNAYNFHSPVFTVAIISSSTLTIPDIQIPITGKYPFVDENGITKIDYIIANHGEQDHTGSIPALLEKYPNAVVVTNPKCAENIKSIPFISKRKN